MLAIAGVQQLNAVERADHHVDKVVDLLFVSSQKLFEGVKRGKVACFWAHLFAGHLADAVKERQFQAFCQVKIAGIAATHGIALASRLHASHNGVIQRIDRFDTVAF